jgi:hypothetical protein
MKEELRINCWEVAFVEYQQLFLDERGLLLLVI